MRQGLRQGGRRVVLASQPSAEQVHVARPRRGRVARSERAERIGAEAERPRIAPAGGGEGTRACGGGAGGWPCGGP